MKRLPTVAVPAIAVIAGLPTFLGWSFAGTAYTVAFALFVVLAWLGVRRQTGRARLPYALIASALTAWLAGDLMNAFLSWQFDQEFEFSPADALWIAGYPLLTAGLIQLVRLRAPGRLREAVLDGLAMTVVVSTLFWRFLISPAIVADDFGPAQVLGILYPFGDVLFFVAGALLVLAPGGRSGPTRYLVGALAITFFGDVTISLTPYWFPGFDDTRLDGLLLLANSLLAAALCHPSAARLAEPATLDADERLHPGRVVFLGVSLMALPSLADLQISDAVLGRAEIMTAMVLLTTIVLTRFMLVVRAQERGRSALAHRATHDQLTGLINRQELHHRLTTALGHASGGGPVVHFLDLNGFKPINDRYGHAAGDRVLAEVARRLRATVRATETVARLGGDEFVVLSPTVAEAAGLTKRLRQAITEPIVLSTAPDSCGQPPAEPPLPSYIFAHPVNGVGVAAGPAPAKSILKTSPHDPSWPGAPTLPPRDLIEAAAPRLAAATNHATATPLAPTASPNAAASPHAAAPPHVAASPIAAAPPHVAAAPHVVAPPHATTPQQVAAPASVATLPLVAAPGESVSVTVQVSIGVAVAGALTNPTSDSLLAAADAAMYSEKALTS